LLATIIPEKKLYSATVPIVKQSDVLFKVYCSYFLGFNSSFDQKTLFAFQQQQKRLHRIWLNSQDD
jgi:hypothetical protein